MREAVGMFTHGHSCFAGIDSDATDDRMILMKRSAA